jgi:hypothetical protein
MNALWAYFWPVFGSGLIIGAIAGSFAFRLRPRRTWARSVAVGVAISIVVAALWHGPIGAADRFTARIDRTAQAVLVRYEMDKQVHAALRQGPLAREILLSGQADDFQRSELVRYMKQLPGVSEAAWSSRRVAIPLLAEGAAAALVGFGIGLLLAYLVALRRRHNAQWRW